MSNSPQLARFYTTKMTQVQRDSDWAAYILDGEAVDAINCLGHLPKLSVMSMAVRLTPFTALFLLAYLLLFLYARFFGFRWHPIFVAWTVVDIVGMVLRRGRCSPPHTPLLTPFTCRQPKIEGWRG
ncbi:unnamed protein product [Taenia asiatica]|uniref:DUF2335 domain-containing protein n=1 Tax=Taenia asiatica TaxID=60517 RepID=A0A0R3VYU9_TAEAS|nr:unnamed protein product [Taenia asiatica]